MIQITGIRTYPIKSAAGLTLPGGEVHRRGLAYDRRWALFDADNVVITARDHPRLLRLTPEISAAGLAVTVAGETALDIPFQPGGGRVSGLKVWEDTVDGVEVGAAASAWFSDYLAHPCRLIHMDADARRPVDPEDGGVRGDVVSYADACPLLLISEASLADLNGRLETPVTMANFRPNIVVSGCPAFAEDGWSRITIGGCEFQVGVPCQRCVLTTIDPVTGERHPEQEPLRTLSRYRRHPQGGVSFGVYLIPRALGAINTGDEVVVH